MSPTPTPVPEPVATLAGARKRYGDVVALHGLDLALRPGEVTALLGPNGAGKTTAVALLLGLLRPDAGEARLFGHAPQDAAARVRTGAMLQVSGVPATLTVREHVELVASYYARPLGLDETLALAGLGGVAERLYGKLSGGQQRRLLFALAIVGDPDLLFLDEPTVGLDVEARRSLWQAVETLVASGRTVLLTTHHLEEAEALARRVVVLHRGRKVADGTPEEVCRRVRGRRLRFRTVLPADEIRRWPEVAEVTADGDALRLVAGDAEAVARRLLLADPALADLEIHRAGLEEALLALTADDGVSEVAA